MPDRVIRDELLDSDRWLGLCSDSERLAFIGLVLQCDDFGNLEGGTHKLYRYLSAFTQIRTAENVATVLLHLADCDLIRHYQVDGRQLIHIPRLRPHRDYLVRKFPPSPWCDPDTALGKHKRIYNKGLAKGVVTTSHKRGGNVALTSDQGVGVGVGENIGSGAPVDNSARTAATTHARASTLKVKGNGAQWWRTDDGIAAKAAELHVVPRAGETFAELKARLFDAIRQP